MASLYSLVIGILGEEGRGSLPEESRATSEGKSERKSEVKRRGGGVSLSYIADKAAR